MATAAKKKDVRPTSMNLSREQLSNVNFKNVSAHSIEADIVAAEYWKADNYGSRRNQYVCALIASLGSVCMGCCLGWSSPALPYLEGEGNSKFAITKEESSWIGSLLTLGAVVGALPTGYMVDTIGRKLVQIIISILYILSWVILLAIEESLFSLYLARISCGIATGALMVVLPLYIEEISQVDVRGRLGCFQYFMALVGIIFIFVAGFKIGYIWLNMCGAALSAVYFISILWIPESPFYLHHKRKVVEADEVHRWLRSVDETYATCYARERVPESFMIFDVGSEFDVPYWELFTCPLVVAVLKIFLLVYLQQMCGVITMVTYLNSIVVHLEDHVLWMKIVVLCATGTLCAAGFAVWLIEIIGRIKLTIISLVGSACFLLMLTVQEALDDPFNFSSTCCISSAIIVNYLAFFCLGLGPVLPILIVEYLPDNVKSQINSFAVSCYWLVGFTMSSSFKFFKFSYVFCGSYCIVCCVGAALLVLYLPETAEKSKKQILCKLKLIKKPDKKRVK